jgi:AcrR family transcriptional regulator
VTAKRRRAIRGSGEQLRDEIVVAAKKLLADANHADEVSIRAVADAVGVTPPSIYLHFADKNDLISAVVADTFRELDDAMLTGASDADSPMARLRAFGLAYIRFAISHPEHYRLAAMDPCPKPNIEVDDVLRSSAFEHFQATVVECIEAGIFVADDPLPITFALWSAAHGVASLVIAKPYLPWGNLEEFADRVLCAAAAGHAVTGLFAQPPTPDSITTWILAQKNLPS